MKLKTTTYIIIGLLVCILALEAGLFIYVRSLICHAEPQDYQSSQLEVVEEEDDDLGTQTVAKIGTVTINGLHEPMKIEIPNADYKSIESTDQYITPDTLIIISPGMIVIE